MPGKKLDLLSTRLYLCDSCHPIKIMEPDLSPAKQIIRARKDKNLSQAELADRCRLNIRTIQRIENEEVTPRLYTLRIISEALGINLVRNDETAEETEQLRQLRRSFERRKKLRLLTFVSGLAVLAVAFILLVAGIPKLYWAPFFYIFFFTDLIIIGLIWRCPGCNGLLGDVFNVRYCSKCGLKFYDETK